MKLGRWFATNGSKPRCRNGIAHANGAAFQQQRVRRRADLLIQIGCAAKVAGVEGANRAAHLRFSDEPGGAAKYGRHWGRQIWIAHEAAV